MTDRTAIIIGSLAALPGILGVGVSLILGLKSLAQGRRTHETFNSKMDLMLKAVGDAAFAEGQKKEKADNAVAQSNFQAGQLKEKESHETKNPTP